MPDWNALRRRAYEQHLQLRAFLPEDAQLLPSADNLLQAAEEATDITRVAVPPSDGLLAGAHAVLDRDIPGIWYASGPGVSRARQLFAQAHEFAHFWLHPEIGHDECFADDSPDAFAPPSFRLPNSQLAEGYSHKERRESEANLFAAELLLPGPLLRELFLEHGWKAARVAVHSGLSLSCVLTQLASALLLGKPEDGIRKTVEGTSFLIPHSSSLMCSQPSALNPQLDDSQRAAARIEHGPVLVDAGPGTGKTRTLIARILFLLTERGVAPENILALTFSNKAAEEMHTRLRQAVGDLADRVWIGTFHAFGRELLRKEGTRIGLPPAPELLDTPDAIKLLQDNLDRLHLHHLEYLSFPILPFPDILNCISRAKDELKTPDDYALAAQQQQIAVDPHAKKADVEKHLENAAKSREVAHVYAVYQELLKKEGKLDFGDLIMRSVELLDTCPDVRERWQAQYPHILADEYQDINRASAQLVQRLAGTGRGLWAVGDLRQAIYRFRGASSANVRKFHEDFPGGQRIQLERNYRSRPSLVTMFGAYAGGMAGTTATFSDWQPQREQSISGEENPAVMVAVADNEDAQAAGLAAHIRQAEAGGVPLRDQVILCQTHRQAAGLAERLGANGIETQHASGLFEREETKDLLAWLALACEPEGSTLARVARFAEYDVPQSDVLTLLAAARDRRKQFPAALLMAHELAEVSEQGRRGFARMWRHMEPYLYHGTAWTLLAGYLFEASDYLLPLLRDNSVAGRQKLLAIHELLVAALRLAKRFEGLENQQAELLKHLRFLRTCGQEKALRVSGDDAELDGVRLMTVHRSKGLEFPIVYLPNLVKGQFPPKKQGHMVSPPAQWLNEAATEDDEEENSEAECLFFVALSRARDMLVLSRPLTWNGKSVEPSPLLTDCEAALRACNAQHVAWSGPQPPTPSPKKAWEKGSALVEGEAQRNDVVTFTGRTESDIQMAEPTDAGMTAAVVPTQEEQSSESLTLSASAVEQYRRCPRQYYYQRVLKLPQSGEEGAYLTFHNSLQETVGWLQAERAEGRTPTEQDAQDRLHEVWNGKRDAPNTAHARVLKEKALGLLTAAHDSIGGVSETSRGVELTAQLEHGAVKVRVDSAEQDANGEWRITTYRAQRDKDDHTNPRLSLARHAARQQSDRPVQIVLGYMDNGEQREIEEKLRYEPDRVAKYNDALKGIREKRFEPNPSQECNSCPFFLVCPL